MASKRFLIVDGTNIAIFASFGGGTVPALSTDSAVRAIRTAAKMMQATHLIVALDGETPTFRKAIAEDYKAGRSLSTKDYTDALRVACVERDWLTLTADGFEADDVVATLCERLRTQECVVFSGDSDALALICSSVAVLRPKKIQQADVWLEEHVFERYGVQPHQLADFKAIVGEKGDNIAGVPGIGAKKAARLLIEHGSLHNILHTMNSTDREVITVQMHSGLVQRALSLTTLRRDVPLPTLSTALCRYQQT